MTFATAAFFTSLICFALAIIWFLFPKVLLHFWGVPYSEPVGLMARRGAALFLGLAIMFFLARGAGPSPLRADLTLGMTSACAGLAGLGIYEFARKHAGPGIWLAIFTEIAIAAAFFWT